MKIAEALSERADIQTRLADLERRIKQNAVIQEGEKPAEPPYPLIAESEHLLRRLEWLMRALNYTNARTPMPTFGGTLTDAIAARDIAGRRHRFYRALADEGVVQKHRYSNSELKSVSTLDVQRLRSAADDAARTYRELDVALQSVNWTTDLLDPDASSQRGSAGSAAPVTPAAPQR